MKQRKKITRKKKKIKTTSGFIRCSPNEIFNNPVDRNGDNGN
jgi:hypothetical protein